MNIDGEYASMPFYSYNYCGREGRVEISCSDSGGHARCRLSVGHIWCLKLERDLDPGGITEAEQVCLDMNVPSAVICKVTSYLQKMIHACGSVHMQGVLSKVRLEYSPFRYWDLGVTSEGLCTAFKDVYGDSDDGDGGVWLGRAHFPQNFARRKDLIRAIIKAEREKENA